MQFSIRLFGLYATFAHMERKEFIEALVMARKERGLSQDTVAARMGLLQTHVSRLESARHSVAMQTLLAYIQALGGSLYLDSAKIPDYEALLVWLRSKTKSIYALSLRIGASGLMLRRTFAGKAGLSCDVFLKAVTTFSTALTIE